MKEFYLFFPPPLIVFGVYYPWRYVFTAFNNIYKATVSFSSLILFPPHPQFSIVATPLHYHDQPQSPIEDLFLVDACFSFATEGHGGPAIGARPASCSSLWLHASVPRHNYFMYYILTRIFCCRCRPGDEIGSVANLLRLCEPLYSLHTFEIFDD